MTDKQVELQKALEDQKVELTKSFEDKKVVDTTLNEIKGALNDGIKKRYKSLYMTINQLFRRSSLLYIIDFLVLKSITCNPAASQMACPAAVSHSIVGANLG